MGIEVFPPVRIRSPLLTDAFASPDGLRITALGPWLAAADVDLDAARDALPEVTAGGVQQAPRGVVQDPAGTAVGSGLPPAGGGAAGAIYAAFPDLLPIDPMPPGASVFNRSTGPGRRVLHTHSPVLPGAPDAPRDARQRSAALLAIAGAYGSALAAFATRAADAAGDLGEHGDLLALVPVSAGIFAGAFRDPTLQHLHPSYTIAAIALAIADRQKRGRSVPALRLYYFGAAPRAAARAARAALQAGGGQ